MMCLAVLLACRTATLMHTGEYSWDQLTKIYPNAMWCMWCMRPEAGNADLIITRTTDSSQKILKDAVFLFSILVPNGQHPDFVEF